MTVGDNPIDRSKLGTKRHILTDKQGIPLSTVITSVNKHGIKAVTDVLDNSVPYRPFESAFKKKNTRRNYHHLYLDSVYSSKSIENEIIKRWYVPHIPYKRKRGQQMKEENKHQKRNSLSRNKRWVVEGTNSWHNRFRKLLIRFEKKVENYLGLVQLSSSIIIYRKIILGYALNYLRLINTARMIKYV